jgi:integrase
VLRLIKRHLKTCTKTSETDFECEPRIDTAIKKADAKKTPKPRCPFRIVGPHPLKRGKVYRENTETSDERVAKAKLLQRETQFVLEPDKAIPKKTKTLSEAVAAFLRTKVDTSDSRQRKFKNLFRKQASFVEAKYGQDPIITQIQKTDLDEFVTALKGTLSTRTRDRENLKQFWLYCADSDFITKNIAAKLKTVGTKRDHEQAKNKPIPTFRLDEVAAFDRALDRCDEIFGPENEQAPDAAVKTRAFNYVIKFSGLAIVDVVTLRPSDVGIVAPHSSTVPITKERRKTGKIAHTGVPHFVWDMLQELKPESEYYFWSGIDKPDSRVDTFRDRMKKLFVAAGIRVFRKTARKKSGGKLKKAAEQFDASSAVPHMWRHTLVRDLYVKNVPVRRIADILGDEPQIVTKHYSQFDGLRQQQAMDTLDNLYQSDPVVQRHGLPKKRTGTKQTSAPQ